MIEIPSRPPACFTPKAFWRAAAVALALAGMPGAPAQPVASPPPEKVDQEIAIGVVSGKMKFDVDTLEVKPDSRVRLTLRNGDVMQHNLVICKPGADTGIKVAQQAWALGAAAMARQYVPDSPDVLFHTRLVDPGASDSFVFKIPATEGDYPYVCTMPGHAFTMKGVMHVRRSAASALPNVPQGISPPPKQIALNPGVEPVVQRALLPDAAPGAVAVGFPDGFNYCFDTVKCAVHYAWAGQFLDMGPNLNDRGGGQCEVLGQRFELGTEACPLRLGGNGPPVVEYAGYRAGALPQLLFKADGQEVRQTVAGEWTAQRTRAYRYTFDLPGAHTPVRFIAPGGELQISSRDGTLQQGVLTVPAEKAAHFSLLISPLP